MLESVEDLIDQINTQEFAKAQAAFNSIIADKTASALDAEKIKVAGQIFNGDPSDEEEEQLELDLEDQIEEDDLELDEDEPEE